MKNLVARASLIISLVWEFVVLCCSNLQNVAVLTCRIKCCLVLS